MSQLRLNSFLKFGYFLDYAPRYAFDLSLVKRSTYAGVPEEQLVRSGAHILTRAITESYLPGRDNVVPLSGGLDSRAVLACLRECTESANIHTYTFGTPGTLDFDIGNAIGRRFGTRHRAIPLTEHRYTLDTLLDVSRRTDHQTLVFHTAPVELMDSEYGGHIHWSGAFAGTPSGNVLPKVPSATRAEAKSRFIAHKYTHVQSCQLTNCPDQDLHSLLETEWLAPDRVTYDEQLHLQFAQLRWIAPHVLMDGFEYRTPFLDREWLGFIMSIADQHRYNQRLYKKILLHAFPAEFSLPTKSHYGVPLGAGRIAVFSVRARNRIRRTAQRWRPRRPNPKTNYIDFASAIRLRSDVREVIGSSIMDLRSRGIVDWVDIESLWSRHLSGTADFSDALLVLASLEIHCKARGDSPLT